MVYDYLVCPSKKAATKARELNWGFFNFSPFLEEIFPICNGVKTEVVICYTNCKAPGGKFVICGKILKNYLMFELNAAIINVNFNWVFEKKVCSASIITWMG